MIPNLANFCRVANPVVTPLDYFAKIQNKSRKSKYFRDYF
jgi:hypothetical protein